MSAKSDLIIARDEMITVLEAKLSNMPEWRALRAIDRALEAVGELPPTASTVDKLRRRSIPRVRLSYAAIARLALEDVGRPLTTPEIIERIAAHRDLGDDAKRARINIQSALSKDEHIQNVAWRGATAWWLADREVPKTETAGLPFTQNPADLAPQGERG